MQSSGNKIRTETHLISGLQQEDHCYAVTAGLNYSFPLKTLRLMLFSLFPALLDYNLTAQKLGKQDTKQHITWFWITFLFFLTLISLQVLLKEWLSASRQRTHTNKKLQKFSTCRSTLSDCKSCGCEEWQKLVLSLYLNIVHFACGFRIHLYCSVDNRKKN